MPLPMNTTPSMPIKINPTMRTGPGNPKIAESTIQITAVAMMR
jgi:hypothetical protein